jgi:predicted RNase H-like nuclease
LASAIKDICVRAWPRPERPSISITINHVAAALPHPAGAALAAKSHAEASAINFRITGRGLSQQAWGIVPKIKQVDDAMTPECQQ